jgi:flagellar biosynthesis protein FlhA
VNKKAWIPDHAPRILRLDHSNRSGRAGVCDACARCQLCPRPAAHAQHYRVGAGAADCDSDSAPVQFSVFPSLILLLTLMRLSLDLASTRRILLHGSEGSSAAGKVIEAFGQFVVGGNYIVGFVIFLALIAIQYLVVSHGAVRTAEVTARFTLDAMPGKADGDRFRPEYRTHQRRSGSSAPRAGGARSGVLRLHGRRGALQPARLAGHHSHLVINIVAGFLIGVFQQGVPFQQALKTYTILTVGDGLVAIIPSLLVSVAGGIVVTRAGSDHSLGVGHRQADVLDFAPAVDCQRSPAGLALIPGMPKISFVALGGITMFAAWKMKPPSAEAAAAKAARERAALRERRWSIPWMRC